MPKRSDERRVKGESDLFQLHQEDARNLLNIVRRGINTIELDTTITSPPYYDILSYGSENEIGHGQDYETYISELGDIFENIRKITKKTGSLWVIVDTFNREGETVLLPFDIANELKKRKWILKDIIIWKKDKTRPWVSKGQLRDIYEYVLFFSKTNNVNYYSDRIREIDVSKFKEWWVKYPERYNPNGILPNNVWEIAENYWDIPIPMQGSWSHNSLRHYCPLPIELIQKILLLTSNEGDIICDPFAGTGTVLAVANSMNRKAIGTELNPDYIKLYNNEMKNIVEKEVQIKYKYSNQQNDLNKTIIDLRLVKICKEIIKYIKNNDILTIKERSEINTIFCHHKTYDIKKIKKRLTYAYEDVYIILNKYNNRVSELDFNKMYKSRKINKYQIDYKIIILDKKEFITDHSKIIFKNDLYLYANSITNRYEKKITFDEWVNQIGTPEWKKYYKNDVPPIISNIKLDVIVNKTWLNEKDKQKIIQQYITSFDHK